MEILKLYGPPGTGKTSALLEILERELASGVDPERVAFMSFTVAARLEAKNRVIEKFGFKHKQLHKFRTIHSASFLQMGIPRTAIVTPDKIEHFSRVCNIEFSRSAVGYVDNDNPMMSMMSSKVEGDRMMAIDHLRRHRLQDVETALGDWDGRPAIFKHFVDHYVQWKNSEGLYDFTDILHYAQEPLDVEVVFIDEAQDLSRLQWQAVWRLCGNADRMYVAGDDDQAIFEWAGADPHAFVDLEANDTQVLGQSWRVPAQVHKIADVIVRRIRDRAEKKWNPRQAPGHVRWENDPKWWTPEEDGTTFVLARNKIYLSAYEAKLRAMGIPYRPAGKITWIGEKWTPAIVAWEKRRNGRDLVVGEEEAIRQAIMPGAAIHPSVPWFKALNRISESDNLYLRAVLERYGNAGLLEPPRVVLSTIHGVKGREADHVVMDTRMSRICSHKLHDSDPDGEARVYYVAVTRARQSLTLVGHDHPLIPVHLFGKERRHAG